MRPFSLTLIMLVTMAQVAVPLECVDLAKREGYPTDVMSKSQALKARAMLATLSNKDPDVKACRQAIKRVKDDLARSNIHSSSN